MVKNPKGHYDAHKVRYIYIHRTQRLSAYLIFQRRRPLKGTALGKALILKPTI
jgi:hypothetical protein